MVPEKHIGKTVETARVTDDTLTLVFSDNTSVAFFDAEQSCCERRYMTCDDELSQFTGERLHSASVLEVATQSDDEYGDLHEVQFLHVKFASGSVLTCQSHNEHNGYYGGFDIKVT